MPLNDRDVLTSEAHNLIEELKASGLHSKVIYTELAKRLGLKKNQAHLAHFGRMATMQQILAAKDVLHKMVRQRERALMRTRRAQVKQNKREKSNKKSLTKKQTLYAFNVSTLIRATAEHNAFKREYGHTYSTTPTKMFLFLRKLRNLTSRYPHV